MHTSSYDKMQAFVQQHLDSRRLEHLRIFDLGSQDVNGSYRLLFDNPGWQYLGLDMAPGNNVDIVLSKPYAWQEIPSASVDVVISGQAFEHIRYMWISILEVARILKPGGLCCVIAPSSGPEHRYPHDCWRIYPDGMRALAEFAQMDVLHVSTQWHEHGYLDCSDSWHDSLLICQRPDNGRVWNAKSALKRWLQHRALTIGLR
ncbi:Methyltransferase domain-containing protein [Pseudomonas pohangensis]|uniref:Methyltransferase domain-containing protein n=1 Tax=Pseudomonas pohangensis TaxID=364197 RepID=A0A1H2EFI9_9PSED|nr:methyltransferase domain-containing protein [Pseudomonas pohangensis]SDT93769.1 Methyltransferase domain-containing protein [Pseudomonas pohangensis]